MIEEFALYLPMTWVADGLLTAAPLELPKAGPSRKRRHLMNAGMAFSAAALSITLSAHSVALPEEATVLSNPAVYGGEIAEGAPVRSVVGNPALSDARSINRSFNDLFDSMRHGRPLQATAEFQDLLARATESQTLSRDSGPAEVAAWAKRLTDDVKDAED